MNSLFKTALYVAAACLTLYIFYFIIAFLWLHPSSTGNKEPLIEGTRLHAEAHEYSSGDWNTGTMRTTRKVHLTIDRKVIWSGELGYGKIVMNSDPLYKNHRLMDAFGLGPNQGLLYSTRWDNIMSKDEYETVNKTIFVDATGSSAIIREVLPWGKIHTSVEGKFFTQLPWDDWVLVREGEQYQNILLRKQPFEFFSLGEGDLLNISNGMALIATYEKRFADTEDSSSDTFYRISMNLVNINTQEAVAKLKFPFECNSYWLGFEDQFKPVLFTTRTKWADERMTWGINGEGKPFIIVKQNFNPINLCNNAS